MINPWTWWIINDPEDIPDIIPHDEEEARDCLFGCLGACLASLIFVGLDVLMLVLVIKYDYNMFILPIGILVNTIIYVVLIIVFVKLGFKISERFNK